MSDKKKENPEINEETIAKLLELIAKAYEKKGRKLTHAMLVDDIDEEGNLKGKTVLDNRDKTKIN